MHGTGFDFKNKQTKHEGGKPSTDVTMMTATCFAHLLWAEAFTCIKSCILTMAPWAWYSCYPHFTQRPGGDPGRPQGVGLGPGTQTSEQCSAGRAQLAPQL